MSMLNSPMHPGEVLKTLYLEPLEMSAITLARRLDVPRTRIERLVRGDTALSADTALRLSRFFNTSAEYWMNLQRAWDLNQAKAITDTTAIEPLRQSQSA
jgi:addiction module HigA family antidote